jgi:hypothetical protein
MRLESTPYMVMDIGPRGKKVCNKIPQNIRYLFFTHNPPINATQHSNQLQHGKNSMFHGLPSTLSIKFRLFNALPNPSPKQEIPKVVTDD